MSAMKGKTMKKRDGVGGEVKQGPHCTLKDLTDLFAHV